ncbi:acid-sensing ion channel 5-like [Hydractinia symbiolongicarpus]|uniref:acid-sensing ion channel 5-like n=1 Tax=Hydractinia symbiolongicarpus TaxID=13093 RepID=UPI00254B84E9|nr:acid-sensing ion channel 5-like [Hydractinia symbiolongicarpus]
MNRVFLSEKNEYKDRLALKVLAADKVQIQFAPNSQDITSTGYNWLRHPNLRNPSPKCIPENKARNISSEMGTVPYTQKHNGTNVNGNTYELEMVEMMIDEDEKNITDEGVVMVESVDESEDDNLWHEVQMSKKLVIQKKIDEYVNSFTVHGLTKVMTGSKVESIFWAIMLLGGIILSIVIVHGLVSKFLKFGIYTEIRSQITDQNYFPSVTFCENRLLIDSYFSYCGVRPRSKHARSNVTCKHEHRMPYRKIKSDNYKYWYNGLFNITRCVSWGGKRCASSKYFKSLRYFNHSCITWNYEGTMHDIYSHFEIDFTFTPPAYLDSPVEIMAVPHDPEIYEIDVTSKVDLAPHKQYDIKLDKTVIKRLPAPYPSNCSSKKTGDIFPGTYTRRSCIESQNYIKMFKECGDTFDYIRQFMPKDIVRRYQSNMTIRQTEMCIWHFGQEEAMKSRDCPFPCEDLDLGILTAVHEKNSRRRKVNKYVYHVSIQYQRVDTYKIMEEKELYSWDQMACEIGGLIGLVIGASIISLVEIFAYIFLLMFKRFV